MRLLKFLNEAFDYNNSTFKLTIKSSDKAVGTFQLFNKALNKTFTFTTEYPYGEINGKKTLQFGFTRDGVRPIYMYFATRDFNESPIKVFAGVLQGLSLALKYFTKTEQLIGTALFDPDDVNHRSTLTKIYGNSSFIKAVEKHAPGFRFDKEETKANGDTLWYYSKR